MINLHRNSGQRCTDEALTAGTPVIGLSYTRFEEIVTDKIGCLIPHGNAIAMRAAPQLALGRLAQDPASNGLSGRAHVLAHFSPEGVAERHMDLYRSLVADATHYRAR